MKTTGYIQIKAERTWDGRVKSITPVRLTKGPPANPEADAIVVKVEMVVPLSAFEPYIARGEVPEGIKAVPMTVEDPNENEEADDGS